MIARFNDKGGTKMTCDHVCPISQMRRIVLATDGSSYSEGAIREAIEFAKKCSSRLTAVTVLETNPEYETVGRNVFEKEEAEFVKHLETVKERAAKSEVSCETIFHSGVEAAQAIVEEASERNADMVVIGRHGRTGLAKLLMGETAAKVVGNAPSKVLVVPRAAQIAFKTLLVAVDGSTHSQAAVKEAMGIAKCSGSTLIALSAARDNTEIANAQALVNKVLDLGKQEGVAVEAVTPIGRSYDAIVETAGGRGVDLIVMGAYGKTGLKKMLMGSSTEKVIGKAGCAVLIMKNGQGGNA